MPIASAACKAFHNIYLVKSYWCWKLLLINDPLLKSDENVIEKFSIQSSPWQYSLIISWYFWVSKSKSDDLFDQLPVITSSKVKLLSEFINQISEKELRSPWIVQAPINGSCELILSLESTRTNHTWVSAGTCECDVDVRPSSVDNGRPADRLTKALLCPRVHEPVRQIHKMKRWNKMNRIH